MYNHVIVPLISTLLFVALLSPVSAKVQNPTSLTKAANHYAHSFVTQDARGVANATHPLVVQAIGGKSSLIKIIEDLYSELKSEGAKITAMEFQEPTQYINIGHELHALLPYVGKIKTEEGTIVHNSFYLAWSGDTGQTWYFIDGAKITHTRLKSLFPHYNNEFNFPQPTLPTLVEE